MLDTVASYYRIRFQGKLINQTWEKGKKINFGPDFDPLGQNSGHQFFSLKNLASSVTRYHGHLSSFTILEKTNDPILRKISDEGGRTDEETDEQTNKSDFIGRSPTNVDHPKIA